MTIRRLPSCLRTPCRLTAAAGANAATARPAFESTLESVARELMRDRRAERRWRIFFRLAWLGVVLALLWALFVARNNVTAPSGLHTALVEVRGEIAPDTEASAERIVAGLKAAFEDKSAQAVVLRINSPGGSPVQAGIVYDEIKRLKAKHNKKVYAVVEEICASGAYYIAVAADEIYVDKASLVGSHRRADGRLRLHRHDGKARRRAAPAHRRREQGHARPVQPAEREADRLCQSHDRPDPPAVHHAVVKEGRGARLKANADTFSGLFWNGEEAIKLGLADKVGNLDFVAREVVKAEEIIDYTTHDNLAERFAKRFGAAIGHGAVKALRELPPLR